eukprot:TRINITY_DN63234_c0_g1_i1.p1 TRINITY_DN63234_c0_g1~~TRINITY_DN63234_c0_g1_i1.p1  ORF type:complete len:100 (-),score=10.83 TRINITY_DN63234_c0_g1_i1:104-403(-)
MEASFKEINDYLDWAKEHSAKVWSLLKAVDNCPPIVIAHTKNTESEDHITDEQKDDRSLTKGHIVYQDTSIMYYSRNSSDGTRSNHSVGHSNIQSISHS